MPEIINQGFQDVTRFSIFLRGKDEAGEKRGKFVSQIHTCCIAIYVTRMNAFGKIIFKIRIGQDSLGEVWDVKVRLNKRVEITSYNLFKDDYLLFPIFLSPRGS